jgi:glutathione reductase (NADPH)
MTENGTKYDFDLLVIGAGSGGTRAARFAAQNYGAKVGIVELPFAFIPDDKHGGAGGTCVIRGCVPKKLLVYGSEYSDDFQDARGFGWEIPGQPKFHWKTLIQKKAKEIARLNSVYDKLLKDAGVEMFEGWGEFVDPHTVKVSLTAGGEKTVTAQSILIATGGRAVRAPIEGSEHAITSDEALALDDLPEHNHTVVTVGAGYISLEFAHIFHGFGCETHVMYRKAKPLRGFDEECCTHIQENMEKRGMHVHPETSPTKIEKNEDGTLTVHYKGKDGQEHSLVAGIVMFGTGRKPNTNRLGIEKAGVELDDAGAVKVDTFSRTNQRHIFAVGDVTNRLNLTPVALMEGMAVAATLFGEKEKPADHKNVPSAVFIQPPMGTVGLTEEQAREAIAGDIDVYVSKFRAMKNTITGRDEKTLVKIIVEVATDKIMGVHMVGPDAPEIMQGVAIAMKAGATKAHFDSTVGIHPSAAEELVSMRSRARRIRGRGKEDHDKTNRST